MQITKSVKDPGKQRDRLFNAPAHIRHKQMSAHLTKDLMKSQGIRTLPVRKGDTVRIMRGDHEGFEGKVSTVDLRNYRIFLEGLTREKVDGTVIFVSVHPSKVIIKNLNLDDKWRKAIIERKKQLQKESKKVEEKPVKVAAKPAEEKPVEVKPAVPAKAIEEELLREKAQVPAKVVKPTEAKAEKPVQVEVEAPIEVAKEKPTVKKPRIMKRAPEKATVTEAEKPVSAKKPTIAKARARKKAEAAGEQLALEKDTEAKSTRTKKTAEKQAKPTTKKKTTRKTSAKAKSKSKERLGGA